MLPSVDADATVRWSAVTALPPNPQLPSSDASTTLHSCPQSELGVDVRSTRVINDDTRRKKSRKVMPPIPEGAHPSTGSRASSDRRTPSDSSSLTQTIRSKSGKHSKPSTSRKKSKDKFKLPSNRPVDLAKQPSDLHVVSGAGDILDTTLCNIDVDKALSATPVSSNVLPVESLRKNDQLWTTANTTSEQKSTKGKGELNRPCTFTKLSPLQDLSLNVGSSLPLTVPWSPPLIPPGLARNNVRAAGTTENKFGCVQLGASELVMEITFYQEPHFEVWDMLDNGHVHWPAQINLIVKDSARWALKPLTLPDIRMLDIQCCTKEKFSLYSEFDSEALHTVYYTGARLQDDRGKPLPLIYENGITIEPEWVRSYGKTIGKQSGRGIGIGKRGWYLKLWVPIPMHLFKKRETRTFILHASVWVGDDEGGCVESNAEMTVSHLRREREMN